VLFNFHLFPFSEFISENLRQEHPEPSHSLSWYDLMHGWYWIDVGKAQLFRYTLAAFNQLDPPSAADGRYVDYFVDRLLADVLDLLPAVLEPIPAQLVERLSSLSAWNDWLKDRDTWNAARYTDTDEADTEAYNEEEVEVYRSAGDWWSQRHLDTSYLVAGPDIWLWNDGSAIHIGWDNRDRFLDGVSAWEAELGEFSFPSAAFLAEVAAFHQNLIQAMAARVELASRYWSEPQFALNLMDLHKAQQQQSSRLERALQTSSHKTPTDWERVLASIAAIEEDPEFIALRGQRIRQGLTERVLFDHDK
jgi:hypothetical protein